MKLAILCCSPKSYSTRRLREATVQRGHNVKVLNTLKFAIDLEQGMPDLYFLMKAGRKSRSKIKDLPGLPVAEEVYKVSGTIVPISIPTEQDDREHEEI